MCCMLLYMLETSDFVYFLRWGHFVLLPFSLLKWNSEWKYINNPKEAAIQKLNPFNSHHIFSSERIVFQTFLLYGARYSLWFTKITRFVNIFYFKKLISLGFVMISGTLVFNFRNKIQKSNFALWVQQLTAAGNIRSEPFCRVIFSVHVVPVYLHCSRRAEIEKTFKNLSEVFYDNYELGI